MNEETNVETTWESKISDAEKRESAAYRMFCALEKCCKTAHAKTESVRADYESAPADGACFLARKYRAQKLAEKSIEKKCAAARLRWRAASADIDVARHDRSYVMEIERIESMEKIS